MHPHTPHTPQKVKNNAENILAALNNRTSTEKINFDKRTIDISHTLSLLYFVKKMAEHRYGIRVSESCVDPNP